MSKVKYEVSEYDAPRFQRSSKMSKQFANQINNDFNKKSIP